MRLILGIGQTGRSVADFLARKNQPFIVADSRKNPPRKSEFEARHPQIKSFFGGWQKNCLENIDEIIISPGIDPSENIVIWAHQRKIPIISDIELFARHTRRPVIGITGSNGKSTVATMLKKMAEKSGVKTALCGNIGTPALSALSENVELYILELSSYQLDYTNKLSLDVGAILNIRPDHLDRYQNFDNYANSKMRLRRFAKKIIINAEIETAKNDGEIVFGDGIPKRAQDFGTVRCHENFYLLKGDTVLAPAASLKIFGRHNIENALAALAIGESFGLPMDKMLEAAQNFPGLAHRLEWVCRKNGVDYFNDSKATNTAAAQAAMDALKSRYQNLVMIVGGQMKNEDYRPLMRKICAEVKMIILIGTAKKTLQKLLPCEKYIFAKTLEDAVFLAQKSAKDGAVVLSPACASFDDFENFAARGRIFKNAVLVLD